MHDEVGRPNFVRDSHKAITFIGIGLVSCRDERARHLLSLRNLARRTGGFSEFVPLPFVHMEV